MFTSELVVQVVGAAVIAVGLAFLRYRVGGGALTINVQAAKISTPGLGIIVIGALLVVAPLFAGDDTGVDGDPPIDPTGSTAGPPSNFPVIALSAEQPRPYSVANQILQIMLNSTDTEPRVNEDGYFGPRTHDAVISFQTAKGLTADGVVGAATWLELEKESGREFSELMKLLATE